MYSRARRSRARYAVGRSRSFAIAGSSLVRRGRHARARHSSDHHTRAVMGASSSSPSSSSNGKHSHSHSHSQSHRARDARERAVAANASANAEEERERGGARRVAEEDEEEEDELSSAFDGFAEEDERARRSFFASSTKALESPSLPTKDFAPLLDALRALSAAEAPDADAVFWFELGSALTEPLTSYDERALDRALRPFGERLHSNHAEAGGLYKLARHASRQLALASSANATPVAAINVTVLVSVFLKHFIEFSATKKHGKAARAACVDAFRTSCRYNAAWETSRLNASSQSSPFSDLLAACVDVLSKKRVTASTMALHLSCVRLLLVVTSSQLMYELDESDLRRTGHPLALMLRVVTEPSAGTLVCALLRQIARREGNSGDVFEHQAHGANAEAASGARTVSGTLMSLLWFTNRGASKGYRGDGTDIGAAPILKTGHRAQPSPLADECTNLLLALHTHSAFGASESNPFRIALSGIKDSSQRTSIAASKRDATLVDFEQLTNALCSQLATDKGLLVLYVLLVSSTRYVAYLSSAAGDKTELIVQTLMRELYEATARDASHKLQLITAMMLTLTQDSTLARSLQKFKSAGDVSYYKERILHSSDTSLSSLVIIILSRAIKYNVTQPACAATMLNALGAIANVSSVINDISVYAAQRLVNMLALLTRRYSSIVQTARGQVLTDASSAADAKVCEDFIRILFEILNGLVTNAQSLTSNPEIVYALIHREDLFSTYRTHECFAEYVQNIESVISHYNDAIQTARGQSECASPMSVTSLKRIITQTDQRKGETALKHHDFYPMHFTYREDDLTTPLFLIRYVWCCVYSTSGVYWPPESLALFEA